MNEKIKKLKEIIADQLSVDESEMEQITWYFLEVPVFLQRAVFQIFEAQMDYTARNMIFRRKPSSATPFS